MKKILILMFTFIFLMSNIGLTFAVESQHDIIVNVLDENGNPYTGSVSGGIYTEDMSSNLITSITDGQFVFDFESSEKGVEYTYFVISPRDGSSANSLKIDLQGQDFNGDINLGDVSFQTATLTGTLLDNTGNPINNGDLDVYYANGDSLYLYPNTDGNFAIAPLEVGFAEYVEIIGYNEDYTYRSEWNMVSINYFHNIDIVCDIFESDDSDDSETTTGAAITLDLYNENGTPYSGDVEVIERYDSLEYTSTSTSTEVVSNGVMKLSLSHIEKGLTYTDIIFRPLDGSSANTVAIDLHNEDFTNDIYLGDVYFQSPGVSGNIVGVDNIASLDIAISADFDNGDEYHFAPESDGSFKIAPLSADYAGNITLGVIVWDPFMYVGPTVYPMGTTGAAISLIQDSEPTTPPSDVDDNDSSGGSSGGSSAPVTPSSDLDNDTKEAANELEDLIDDNGTSEELTEKATDVIGSISDDSDNADKQVSEISETISSVVENLDSEEAVSVVEELTDLADKVLDNEEVNVNEAKNMVTDIIESSFAALTDKEDIDLEVTKENIIDLVDKVVEKASTVEANEGTLVDETLEYVVDEDLIANSIAVATDVINDLTSVMEENGITEETEKTINITLPETEGEDISLELDAEAVAELGDNNFGITIEAEGIDITLPAELLSSAGTSMKIKSKPLSNDIKLSSVTKGGKAKELKTLDLDVSNGTESIKGLVELSFSIKDLDVDLDNIMVGVYEDGEWTKIDYEIKGNKVYFTAPHFSIYSLMSYEASFSDIETNWAKQCIESLAAKGIINGRDDVTFDPNSTITRAEYMALLVNYLGLDNDVTANYSDVEQGTWYYDIVGQGAMNGITAGTENGNFRPEDNITREEMSVMLMKAFEVKNGYALTGEELTFNDTDEMSDYAVNYIEAAKTNGIISGYPDNTFRPLETATRAEAATVIYYFLQK